MGNRLLLANDSLFSLWGNDSCTHFILQSPGICLHRMPRPGNCRYPSVHGWYQYHPQLRPCPLFRAVAPGGHSSQLILPLLPEHTGYEDIQALPLRFPTSAVTSVLPCSVPGQVLQQNFSCFFILIPDKPQPEQEAPECVFLILHILLFHGHTLGCPCLFHQLAD